jgi:hypothetical protein
MMEQVISRHVGPARFGGDGAPWVRVGITRAPYALTKTLTNPRSPERLRAITSASVDGDLVRGKRSLPGVGAPRLLAAPILREVHFSDRAQWVVALHERRKGCH